MPEKFRAPLRDLFSSKNATDYMSSEDTDGEEIIIRTYSYREGTVLDKLCEKLDKKSYKALSGQARRQTIVRTKSSDVTEREAPVAIGCPGWALAKVSEPK